MIFFFALFFFCHLSLSRLDKFKLKFSKSHYQPCRGINSNITKAIIFLLRFFFNSNGVLPGNETFFFFFFFGGGGGGGGGEGGGGGVKGHYSVTYKFH